MYIALTHSQRLKGVNSKLPDGRHFLMWDFDGKEHDDIKSTLLDIQKRFKLSRIFLVNTGLPGFYHAYCFRALPWADVLHVLASTEGLDPVYFKIGIFRGFFTLRISGKKGRSFLPAEILPSRSKEDLNPFELTNFSNYWTKRV